MMRKNRDIEYQLQCWLVLWMATKKILFCANAGAGLKLTIGQGVKAKKMGYRAGFPDIQICEPRGKYAGMFIELKHQTYPTDLQKAWQEALLSRGYYAIIVPANLDFLGVQEWVEREILTYLGGGE